MAAFQSSNAAVVDSPCRSRPGPLCALPMRELRHDGPRLGGRSARRLSAAASGEITSASIPAPAEQNSIEPRPRLNHTVTLGEIDVVSARDGVGPLAAAGPSVIVNNYNQVNVVTPTFGYGTLGYSHFSPGRVTVDPSRTSPIAPLPGQNWPALADHGPSFPYGSLPASPWTRSR